MNRVVSHIQNIFFLAGSFIFLMSACSPQEQSKEIKKIARVGEVYLAQEILLQDIPKGLSSEDSLRFVEQYINSWLHEEVVLQKAEEMLPEETKDVRERLEEYRKSLLSFAYEKQFIKERLDTTISRKEIETYYEQHKKDFSLKDYLVKVMYAKFPLDFPEQKNVTKHYRLRSKEDSLVMEKIAGFNALDFFYGEDQWVYFNDLLAKIPLQEFDKISFIKKKRKIHFEDDRHIYYVNIMDYKLKDSESPMEMVYEKIKGILLNIRTNKLRKQLRIDLFNEAKASQKIETY